MNKVYLYVRNLDSRGTLVSKLDREDATKIIAKFKDTSYQVGILCAKDIMTLSTVYGEFKPYKEVDELYIVEVLEERQNDNILSTVEKNNIYDLAQRLLSKKSSGIVNKQLVSKDEVTKDELGILSNIPYSHMAKIGCIPTVKGKSLESRKQKVINLREYIETDNLANMTDIFVACRKQHKVNGSEYALACWLKEGELRAETINTEIFDIEKLKLSISYIKRLTLKTQEEFHEELVELLAKCGIALVLVGKFPDTNVIGATQWIDEGNKAIIQLTLKGKRADSFWFTLLHEIAHIVAHDSKDFHIQDEDNMQLEEEADKIARNWLIADDDYNKFKLSRNFSLESIIKFSQDVNIHHCIVIGRLQYDKILGWPVYSSYKPKVKIM